MKKHDMKFVRIFEEIKKVERPSAKYVVADWMIKHREISKDDPDGIDSMAMAVANNYGITAVIKKLGLGDNRRTLATALAEVNKRLGLEIDVADFKSRIKSFKGGKVAPQAGSDVRKMISYLDEQIGNKDKFSALCEMAKKKSFNQRSIDILGKEIQSKQFITVFKGLGVPPEKVRLITQLYPAGIQRGRNEKDFFEAIREYIESGEYSNVIISNNSRPIVGKNYDVDVFVKDGENMFGVLWDGIYHLKAVDYGENVDTKKNYDNLVKFFNRNIHAKEKLINFPKNGIKLYVIEDNTRGGSKLPKFQSELFIENFKAGTLGKLANEAESIRKINERLAPLASEYKRLSEKYNKPENYERYLLSLSQ